MKRAENSDKKLGRVVENLSEAHARRPWVRRAARREKK